MIIIVILLFLIILFLLNKLYLKKKNGKTLDETLKNKEEEVQALNKEKEILSQDITKYKNNLVKEKEKYENLLKLANQEKELKKSVETLNEQNNNLKNEIKIAKESQKELIVFKEEMDLIEVGFFEEPKYLFETSERFKEEIKDIREQQKKMIQDNEVIEIPDFIALIDDDKIAKQILNKQAKLMLKSFNLECDNLFSLLKPSNFSTILERIEKVAKSIEELSLSFKCGFSNEYIELKFQECELQYQFKLKQQKEKEEQQAIREQMREEQQAIRDYQKAILKAERDEEIYKEALERIKKQLEFSVAEEREKLEKKIETLELKLKEAEESSQRAKSMAEQTKKGHVYIISNIGSFGENIYKIGMTRRLEPMDRINELNNASVPFPFEVHAVIYSENAPELEKKLHNHFSNKRVNMVNTRKEFFNVDLLEIKDTVSTLTDEYIDFRITAIAEDYYESLRLKKMIEANNK